MSNPRETTSAPNSAGDVAFGIEGLDAILGGGLPRDHAYLIQGPPGSGKTTLALQFCLNGAQQGQRVLYISMSASEGIVREVADSHRWSLDGVEIHFHDPGRSNSDESDQSVLHPAEVELPKTMDNLIAIIQRAEPQRLVIDSLSEIRMLAVESQWFRREVLGLREKLSRLACTTLFCDHPDETQQPIQTLVHGVIELEQKKHEYGPDWRRLRIIKIRVRSYSSGFHDFAILTGGIEVYPRVVSVDHRTTGEVGVAASEVAELDSLMGGGADRAAATLLLGSSGSGKSIIASQFAVAAAGRGEKAAIYVFDERLHTLIHRANSLGMKLGEAVETGRINLRHVEPAEMTAGEFSHRVRRDVIDGDVRLVVVDSLSGYLQSTPSEQFIELHLHELLSFLSKLGVTVLLVMTMTQHGLPGATRTASVDLSYLADTVILFHTFEHAGELRKAISIYKRRSGPHESTLRELRFSSAGIHIGEPLHAFQGIMRGTPTYVGTSLPDVDEYDQS